MKRLAALAVLVMCVVPAAALATGSATTTLKANLLGTVEVPKGSPTGKGTATITITGSKVCWKFTYRGLDKPGDSGIHIAPPPAPGKHKTSVFPFTATTSMAPGCVAANHWGPSSAGWAQKIAANPSRFYVIIGTAKYPQGAIGGPLHRA